MADILKLMEELGTGPTPGEPSAPLPAPEPLPAAPEKGPDIVKLMGELTPGEPEQAAVKPESAGYLEQIPIGAKLGFVGALTTAARAIDPASAMTGAGVMPEADNPVWNAPASREERAQVAQKGATEAMFPHGVPEADNLGKQVIRGISESWPMLATLAATGGFGTGPALAGMAESGLVGPAAQAIGTAAIPFALMGTSEENPALGAAKGAVMGASLGGMHLATKGIEKPFYQWLAKIGGGASIGGGFTAAAGGGPEDIARDAIIFGLFEAMGMPQQKPITLADKINSITGLDPKFAEALRKAPTNSPEFASGMEELAKALKPAEGGAFNRTGLDTLMEQETGRSEPQIQPDRLPPYVAPRPEEIAKTGPQGPAVEPPESNLRTPPEPRATTLPDTPIGVAGDASVDAANKIETKPVVSNETPSGEPQVAVADMVFQEGAWWKVIGSDNKFTTQEQALKAAETKLKYTEDKRSFLDLIRGKKAEEPPEPPDSPISVAGDATQDAATVEAQKNAEMAKQFKDQFTKTFGTGGAQGAPTGLVTEGLAPGIDPVATGFQPASSAPGSLPTYARFPTADIELDPQTFQHKRAADLTTGSVGSLKDVPYDEAQAGELELFETKDGRFKMAHGHNRLWAANRDSIPTVKVKVYREVDGWTPDRVKLQAFLRNVTDGRLDSLDIAQYLREIGGSEKDLQGNINLRTREAQNGIGLAGLSPRIWDDVYRGVWGRYGDDLAADKGAALGGSLRDNPETQEAIYQRLIQLQEEGKDFSVNAIRQMSEAGRLAVVTKEAQQNLFGESEADVSRVIERGDLTAYLTRELANEKNALLAANRNRERLESAGNKINAEENKRIASEAKEVLAGFAKFKGIGGSDTDTFLNRYADELAGARSKGESDAIKQRALSDIYSSLAADREAFLASGGSEEAFRNSKAAGRVAPAEEPGIAGGEGISQENLGPGLGFEAFSLPDEQKIPFIEKLIQKKEESPKPVQVRDAIENTPGATLTKEGLVLTVTRFQKLEQAGERSVRAGVFYLPEAKSPWQKHYHSVTGQGKGGTLGYGGRERFEGETVYQRPIFVNASTGGNGPKAAYDLIEGKGAYEKMRTDVLETASVRFSHIPFREREAAVANLLVKYGGNPNFAHDIVTHSRQGNTLAYAIQEHIVGATVRGQGYDSVISVSKHQGKPRLAEVFDVREEQYPWQYRWSHKYEDFYRETPEPKTMFSLFEGGPSQRPLTKFELRMKAIMDEHPEADAQKVSIALRSNPKATNEQIAVLSRADSETTARVEAANAAAQLQKAEAAKVSGGAQGGLFGDVGPAGGLFDSANQVSAAPAPLPRAIAPAPVEVAKPEQAPKSPKAADREARAIRDTKEIQVGDLIDSPKFGKGLEVLKVNPKTIIVWGPEGREKIEISTVGPPTVMRPKAEPQKGLTFAKGEPWISGEAYDKLPQFGVYEFFMGKGDKPTFGVKGSEPVNFEQKDLAQRFNGKEMFFGDRESAEQYAAGAKAEAEAAGKSKQEVSDAYLRATNPEFMAKLDELKAKSPILATAEAQAAQSKLYREKFLKSPEGKQEVSDYPWEVDKATYDRVVGDGQWEDKIRDAWEKDEIPALKDPRGYEISDEALKLVDGLTTELPPMPGRNATVTHIQETIEAVNKSIGYLSRKMERFPEQKAKLEDRIERKREILAELQGRLEKATEIVSERGIVPEEKSFNYPVVGDMTPWGKITEIVPGWDNMPIITLESGMTLNRDMVREIVEAKNEANPLFPPIKISPESPPGPLWFKTPSGKVVDLRKEMNAFKENANEERGAAQGEAPEPENRGGILPEIGAGRERQVADFKSRIDQGHVGNGTPESLAFWRGLDLSPASQDFHESPHLEAIREKAKAKGVQEVIAVKDAPFEAAFVDDKGGKTIVINERVIRGDHKQIADHEFFHRDLEAGDPNASRFVRLVNRASDAFSDYRDTVNRLRKDMGLEALSDDRMAEEIAADAASGISRTRAGDGKEIDLREAFTNFEEARKILTEYRGKEGLPARMEIPEPEMPRPPTVKKGDKIINKPFGEGVNRAVAGETGIVRDVREWNGELFLEVKWSKSGVDYNVRGSDIELPKERAGATLRTQVAAAHAAQFRRGMEHAGFSYLLDMSKPDALAEIAKLKDYWDEQKTKWDTKPRETGNMDYILEGNKIRNWQTRLREAEKTINSYVKNEMPAARDEFQHLRSAAKEETGEINLKSRKATVKQESLFSVSDEEHQAFLDMIAKMKKEREDRFQANREAAGPNPSGVRMVDSEDPTRSVLIHRSTYPDNRGEWQVTSFDDRGPIGHHNEPSLDAAIRFVSENYRNYKVENVSRNARGEAFSLRPAEERQGYVTGAEPMSRKEFEAELNRDQGELWKYLTAPGSRLIPLYEGERYIGSRAGDFIRDKQGKVIQLTKDDIYERFFDPKKPQLPPGTEATRPEDMLGKPGEESAPGVPEEPPYFSKLLRAAREKFSAANLSEKAQQTWQFAVEHMGWAAREMYKDAQILEPFMKRFANMGREELIKFTDMVESNSLANLQRMAFAGQFDPELLKVAQAWRRMSDGLHYLVAESKGGESAYWENYFPRLFKNPEQAAVQIAAYLKSRGQSMTGPEGFNKARSLLLFSEAIKPKEEGGMGLEPLDNNYVNLMKANVWEKLRYLTGQFIMDDLKEAGFIGREQKSGWEALRGDKTLEGYYAEPDVARVLDVFLSKGLRGDPLFKLYNDPVTFMNTVMVGLSAFHATFSIFSDLAHGVGSNLTRAVGAAVNGRFAVSGHYLKELGKASLIPLNLLRGGEMIKEYGERGSYPQWTKIVDLMQQAGIRVNSEEMSTISRSFSEAFRDSKLSLPRKVVEAIAWPIMGYMVPRIKINATARLLQMELDVLAREGKLKDMSRNDLVRLAQDVARKSDNIFGQMVYDNLSMKKAFRDGLRLLIGFPGWNIGSFTDILQAGKGIVHGVGEMGKVGAEFLTGKKPTWEPMSRQNRMSLEFYLGTVLVMSVFGAITQKLLEGSWPQDIKDLLMPKTGATLPNGQAERIRPPTYMRDVLSLSHPVEMAKHKLNWPLRMFSALTDNQDFFGEQIRDPFASAGTQAAQTAKYVGKSLLPFGIQGYMQTESPQARAMNLLGITKVPRLYSNTEAMNIIDEYNKMNRSATTTKQAAAEKALKKELRDFAKTGDVEGFKAKAREAMSSGELTRTQVKAIVDQSQAPPGLDRFVGLPVEWQVRAWRAATPQEKDVWKPYFLKKVMSAKPEILIRNRDVLVPTLQEMGLGDAAERITNLTLPDKAFDFKLDLLGVKKPPLGMSDMDLVDTAMAKHIREQSEKVGKEKEKKGFGKMSLSSKSKPFGILGF